MCIVMLIIAEFSTLKTLDFIALESPMPNGRVLSWATIIKMLPVYP